MKTTLSLFTLAIALLVAASRVTAQDDADKKTIKRILQEIELVPSLYAKGETAPTFKTVPKFSAQKLVGLPIGKINTADRELESWKKDKAQYAKDYPNRAPIFEVAEFIEKVNVAMTFDSRDPKAKAAFLQEQAPLGITLFNLEGILAEMNAADRTKEKMRRWQLDADFARARLLGNLMFLYEYNFTLGTIRADALPDLGPGEVGWKIGRLPKITVTETKAKMYSKERMKLLTKIQDENPGTPWAYFAEKESRREMGMTWVVRKK